MHREWDGRSAYDVVRGAIEAFASLALDEVDEAGKILMRWD